MSPAPLQPEVCEHAPAQSAFAAAPQSAGIRAVLHRHEALGRRAKSYVTNLRWVAAQGLASYWRQALVIVISTVLGLITAFASLGGVIAYVRHAESDQPLRILWWHMATRGEFATLAAYGLALATIGVFSGACIFYAEWRIQRVTRMFEHALARRLLAVISDPACRGWPDLLDVPARAGLTALLSSARFTAFAFRDMLRGILPVLMFAAALGVLVHVDWRLTLMLAPLSLAYLIPLYIINRRVSGTQRDYRSWTPPARRRRTQALRALFDQTLPQNERENWRDNAFGDEHDQMMSAYYRRMLADKRVQFLNTIFFVVCLLALFIYFGYAANSNERPWSDLIAYLVALRFAITGLRQVSSLLVKLSRFFPEYSSYASFVQRVDRLRQRRNRKKSIGSAEVFEITLALPSDVQWNSPATLRVNTPALIWILQPMRPRHLDLELAAARLERMSNFALDASTAFIASDLDECCAAPRISNGAIIAAIPDSSLGTSRCCEAINDLNRGNAQCLALVTASMQAVTSTVQGAGADELAGLVIVMDESGVIAGGDVRWFNVHRAEIGSFIAQRREELAAAGLADDELDDEFDMG